MSGQRVLSYPFRFDMYNRRLGTVNSDADTYKAEQINTFLKTEKGERALFPDFGINDPVFNVFDSAEFIDSFVSFYKPSEIEILEIEINDPKSFGKSLDIAVRFK